DAVRLEIVAHAFQQSYAELLMRHLAAAEPQRDLRLVAFAEKAHEVAELDLVVAFVSAGPELHFLDLNLLQLELRFVLLFRFPVLELPEVHDPGHRRLRGGGDLAKIEFGRFGRRQWVGRGHEADLLAFYADQADFGGVDFAVNPLRLVQGYLRFSYRDKKRPSFPKRRRKVFGSKTLSAGRDLLAEAREQGIEGH